MNRKKDIHMKSIVEGFGNYAGSKKSYCDLHNIKTHVFDYYRKKLKEEEQSKGFVPIQFKQRVSISPMELHDPNGNSLILSVDTPLSILTQLVQISIENKEVDV